MFRHIQSPAVYTVIFILLHKETQLITASSLAFWCFESRPWTLFLQNLSERHVGSSQVCSFKSWPQEGRDWASWCASRPDSATELTDLFGWVGSLGRKRSIALFSIKVNFLQGTEGACIIQGQQHRSWPCCSFALSLWPWILWEAFSKYLEAKLYYTAKLSLPSLSLSLPHPLTCISKTVS